MTSRPLYTKSGRTEVSDNERYPTQKNSEKYTQIPNSVIESGICHGCSYLRVIDMKIQGQFFCSAWKCGRGAIL